MVFVAGSVALIALIGPILLTGYAAYRLSWRRWPHKHVVIRVVGTAVVFGAGYIVVRIVLATAINASLIALTNFSPAAAVQTMLLNHREIQIIGRADPELEKEVLENMRNLAQTHQLNQSGFLKIYKNHIGDVARRGDSESILRYGQAKLALFQASLNEGPDMCLKAIIGTYGPTDIYKLTRFRREVSEAQAAAYKSGKTAPPLADISEEARQELAEKTLSLPNSPLSPQERAALSNLSRGSTMDWCKAMAHQQSNVMSLDETDKIASLREQIRIH